MGICAGQDPLSTFPSELLQGHTRYCIIREIGVICGFLKRIKNMDHKRLTEPALESEIKSGLAELGISFTQTHITRLITYIKEIEKWNTRFNLVKASGRTLIIKHLFDALAGLPVFINTAKRQIILDIGSGAGFPGVPLSVFLPDSRFILSERTRVKAEFLRNIVILLGQKNVEVFDDDFKHLDTKADIITFRAFSRIHKVLDDCVKLLNPGGRVIAYKGRRQKIDEELSGIDNKNITVKIKKVTVPFLDEERHLVILQAISL